MISKHSIWDDSHSNLDMCRLYPEAISMYERALSLFPRGASTYAALGFTFHLQVILRPFLIQSKSFVGQGNMSLMYKELAYTFFMCYGYWWCYVACFWSYLEAESVVSYHQGNTGKAIDYYHKVCDYLRLLVSHCTRPGVAMTVEDWLLTGSWIEVRRYFHGWNAY